MESLGMTRRIPGTGFVRWAPVLLRVLASLSGEGTYETRLQPETSRMPVLHSLADSHQNLRQLFRCQPRALLQLEQRADFAGRLHRRQRQLAVAQVLVRVHEPVEIERQVFIRGI